jgi:hypothetical protein
MTNKEIADMLEYSPEITNDKKLNKHLTNFSSQSDKRKNIASFFTTLAIGATLVIAITS